MPGSITHLIVQQRLPYSLRELGGNKGRQYSDLLLKDPCSPYAAFGSMGPDFLFFSLKEYGTPLDEFANFLFGVYDAFKPLIDFYEEVVAPVQWALENAIQVVDDALFKGLIRQIKQAAELTMATATAAVQTVITGNVDLFYAFYPKIQQGAPEQSWYWVDYLHQRRTGRFGSTMWQLAGSDSDLQRYCLGYTSHIGTDVVGHSFVNALVGGPYRMHWHRHKLIENWIDAYARHYYPDSVLTKMCLRLGSADRYVPDAISGSYYYRACEFPNSRLPGKLAQLILKAMGNTYRDVAYPARLDSGDLDTAYRLWLQWFKMSTTIGNAVKPTPVPPPGASTAQLIQDYWNGIPSYSAGGGGSSGGGFSILGFFAAIWGFFKWLGEVLWYTFEWIVTHAWDIVTLPFTEALALLKWLLYQIQKGIYECYDTLRFMLVMGGYLFPEPGDLSKAPYGQALLNTAYVQLMGGAAANFWQYPRRQETHGLSGPMEHHLIYPGTLREDPSTEPAPLPFHGVYPEVMIGQTHPYDSIIEKLYACKGPYGATDAYTHTVDKNTWSTAQFGSALSFCARLLGQRMNNLPNFNLDSDRGYGWKTWVADDPAHINSNNPVPVTYIDA